jgi:hypothetical protein
MSDRLFLLQVRRPQAGAGVRHRHRWTKPHPLLGSVYVGDFSLWRGEGSVASREGERREEPAVLEASYVPPKVSASGSCSARRSARARRLHHGNRLYEDVEAAESSAVV